MAMYPLLNRNFLLFVQHEGQVCFATTTANDNSSTPAHYWNMEFGLLPCPPEPPTSAVKASPFHVHVKTKSCARSTNQIATDWLSLCLHLCYPHTSCWPISHIIIWQCTKQTFYSTSTTTLMYGSKDDPQSLLRHFGVGKRSSTPSKCGGNLLLMMMKGSHEWQECD